MKIFYGVQGTGNGHITRARVMVKALQKAGIETDFMFTGRPQAQYFDMEPFGDFQYRKGLTFVVEKGGINQIKTLLQSHPIDFVRDVCTLDLSDYDLVVSDFEPVTAWAAFRQKKTIVGIGHQYAFDYPIPKRGENWISRNVMQLFAPVTRGLGLHWHHFGQPILPPIVETGLAPVKCDDNKILVYLPFEQPADIVKALSGFSDTVFHVYSPTSFDSPAANIVYHALSRKCFQRDLHDCNGIISNSGFELISEALQLGKKILVKPLAGQMEQLSNAAALERLEYGSVMNEINPQQIARWLKTGRACRIEYPDVAGFITERLMENAAEIRPEQIKSLWQKVDVERL